LGLKIFDIVDKREDGISEIDHEILHLTQHQASNSEQIKPIHQDLNIYSNSINIYFGPCGSGKSTSILGEVIKLIHYTDVIRLMLYVTKSGSSDDTFKTLEPLLTSDLEQSKQHSGKQSKQHNKPQIIEVADANLISVINKILKWKQLYNDIKDERLENEIIEAPQKGLFDVLSVSDFLRPALTILIIMCDDSNSVSFNKGQAKKDEQFNNEMCDYLIIEHRQRDLGLMFMFGVQKITDLPTDIRANSHSITILNGFPRAEIVLIRHCLNLNITLDELWHIYSNFERYDRIICDKPSKQVIIK
jgi:hypothetical protein